MEWELTPMSAAQVRTLARHRLQTASVWTVLPRYSDVPNLDPCAVWPLEISG
jgi:hypothetical protein